MKIPPLVAHRGYALHYPENTLVGIEAAILAGARHIEIDVQLSADEVPVLFHDRSLRRVCGVTGAIHDYRAADLARFKAMEFERFGYRFARERIATLVEFVQLLLRYPKVSAFVELKRASLERLGATTVLRRVRRELEPLRQRSALISFDLDALAAARGHWPTIGAVIEHWSERKQQLLRALKPEYLFCNIDGLPRWGNYRFEGARVIVYEVADPALALRLARRGVDFIETFAIGEMRAAFAAAATQS